MPSMLHEALLLLFRNRPTLAPELLRDALGVQVPVFTEARVESAELTEVVPTEYRADLVVLLVDGKPVYAIVVEVQLGRDEEKRSTWPLYLASLRSRVGCPTALLVVAPDPVVARWCSEPIEMGHPGWVLRPLVMGRDVVPWVTDPAQAAADPELAVLSAMTHGEEPRAVEVALAAVGGVAGLEDEKARLYLDLVMMALPDAARAALEKLMQSGTYQYQSEFARRYYGQGKAEGKAEGEVSGRLAGAATSLLALLEARGFVVGAAGRSRIEGCSDSAQLEEWVRRAAVAASVEEVFSGKPLAKPAAKAPRKRAAKATKRGKR